MKSSRKTKILILMIFGIIFGFARNNDINSNYNDGFKLDKVKISAVSGKIHIDNNWTDAKNAGICTGNGTYSDPYIIKNLVIDGGRSGNCIWITNSSAYFTIENCTIYQSGIGNYQDYKAGIKLQNVSNGLIINNTIYKNDYGIWLEYCSNNNISEINVNNNVGAGIRLNYSNNNTISEFITSYNSWGIYLIYSDYNSILGSNASHNTQYGVFLNHFSHYNNVSRNIANHNDIGINLIQSTYNNISSNNINNNSLGIKLWDSDYNIILRNNASYHSGGILLDFSDRNTISGNILNYNKDFGIYLRYSSDYNIITENIMTRNGLILDGSIGMLSSLYIDSTNLLNGKPIYFYKNEENLGNANFTGAGQVILISCNNSLISNLNTSNSARGIILYNCYNNNISRNIANNNFRGITLWDSNNNTIIQNTVCQNSENGILLDNSDFNKILENTANNNSRGISLWNSNYNTISGNIVNYNYRGIYLSDYCDRNTISNNNINFNYGGIYLTDHSDLNTIIGNIVNNNKGFGIYIRDSSNYNIITGNLMDKCGLLLDGTLKMLTTLIIDSTNLVNGNPVYCYINKTNLDSNNFKNAGQIILINCNQSLISNLKFSDCSYGLLIFYSNYNTISRNTVNNNSRGIYLWNSDYNTISGNIVNYNYWGVYLSDYCDSNTISNNNINFNYRGIFLTEHSDLNSIRGNIVNNNEKGIHLYYNSNTNSISENLVCNNSFSGISMHLSDENVLLDNIVSYNGDVGILLHYYCDCNTIAGNFIENNNFGIQLYDSDANCITENIIKHNNLTGIVVRKDCDENCIFFNCFNNSINAIDDGLNNKWNKGNKGNYWADYTGSDTNGDGIGDVPYYISGSAGSQDNFPLMTCPISTQDGGGFPLELIIITLVINGGAVIGLATLLLIRRKRKRIE